MFSHVKLKNYSNKTKLVTLKKDLLNSLKTFGSILNNLCLRVVAGHSCISKISI